MTSDNQNMTISAPSKAKILLATGLSLLAAVLILVVAVLPAEYGIDPLRTGQVLGLLGLASAEEDPLTMARGVTTSQSSAYKVDTIEIRLRPGRSVEYKYHLENGAGLVSSWASTGRVIYYFHGQPDGGSAEDSKSYEKRDRGEESERASGSFNAPFTGVHGWYFENAGSDEVTIKLTSAGFYDRAEQFMDKGGHFIYKVGDLQHGPPRQTLTP
jgi:hypothetical protein